jgi:endonuclease/exonuclease/phosphatase family metal-dependent hydrolase
MRKLRLLAFLALFAACALALLAPSAGAWIKTIGGPARADAVAIDAAGDVIAAGHPDFTLVKLSGATGEEKWRFGTRLSDIPSDVAVDASGDVLVATPNGSVIKVSGANGAHVWSKPGCGAWLALDGNGDAVTAGFVRGLFSVCKLSGRTGDEVWRYEREGIANAVAVDASGDVVAVGASNRNFVVVKLRGGGLQGVESRELWARELNGSGSETGSDEAKAVVVDADGSVIATGKTHNAASSDFTVVKYAPDGALRWVQMVDGQWCPINPFNQQRTCQSDDEAQDVTLGRNGSVFAAGYLKVDTGLETLGVTHHFYVAKFSSAGDPVWSRAVRPAVRSDDRAISISVDAAGDVVAAGIYGLRFTVMKFTGEGSQAGEQVWLQQPGPPPAPGNHSTATEVLTDAERNVVAAGETLTGTQHPTFTVVKLHGEDGTDYVEGVGPPPGTNRLGLLTYNIRGGACGEKRPGEDLTRLVDTLRGLKDQHSLDVVALQEVYADQADAIGKGLGFSHAYYFPTVFSCGGVGTRGNAILSRYPIEAKRVEVFAAQEKEGNDEKRNIIGVRIRVGGRPVHIYTTHLTSQGPSSDQPNRIRARQATECVNFIRGERPRAARAILMGDFNAEPTRSINPSAGAYAAVTRNFRDVWALALPPRGLNDPAGHTINTRWPSDPPPRSKRVDYIFLRKQSRLNLVAVSVLNTVDLSDHFPLFARISFD